MSPFKSTAYSALLRTKQAKKWRHHDRALPTSRICTIHIFDKRTHNMHPTPVPVQPFLNTKPHVPPIIPLCRLRLPRGSPNGLPSTIRSTHKSQSRRTMGTIVARSTTAITGAKRAAQQFPLRAKPPPDFPLHMHPFTHLPT